MVGQGHSLRIVHVLLVEQRQSEQAVEVARHDGKHVEIVFLGIFVAMQLLKDISPIVECSHVVRFLFENSVILLLGIVPLFKQHIP